MILSPEVRAYMKVPFKWGQLFGTLPFDWDEEEKVVTLTRSKTRMYVWAFWNIYTAGLGAFLHYRLLQNWDDAEFRENLKDRYSSLLLVCGTYAFFQYEICLALVYKFIPQTFNSVINYVICFQGKYRRFGNRKCPVMNQNGHDFGDLLTLNLNYYLLFLSHTPLWIYLMTSPTHIFHISPSRMLGYAGIQIPYLTGVTLDSMLATTILAAISEIVIATHVLFWVYAVLPLQFAINRLASQFGFRSETIWTRSVLQHPGPFITISRQLAVLSTMIMEIAQPVLLIIPINLILGMTFAAYFAIKIPCSLQKLAASTTFLQMLALFVVVNRIVGKFPTVFANNLDNYLKQRRSKLMEKTLRSIPVPKMVVYSIFTPGNELTITGLQILLDNIISCLTVSTESF